MNSQPFLFVSIRSNSSNADIICSGNNACFSKKSPLIPSSNMKNCHVAYVDLAGAVTAIANFPWISASAPGYMRYASTVPVLSRYPADTSACSSALSYSGCDSIKLPQGTPSDLRTAAPDRHVPLCQDQNNNCFLLHERHGFSQKFPA